MGVVLRFFVGLKCVGLDQIDGKTFVTTHNITIKY